MNSSVEVDSLEILVIVDNVVDPLSTNPPWVEPEIRGLLNRGRIRMLSGSKDSRYLVRPDFTDGRNRITNERDFPVPSEPRPVRVAV